MKGSRSESKQYVYIFSCPIRGGGGAPGEIAGLLFFLGGGGGGGRPCRYVCSPTYVQVLGGLGRRTTADH